MKEQAKLLNANQARPIAPQIISDRDWVLTAKAEYAKELVRGSMHAGVMGECLERYQAMRVLTPTELVTRACDIADRFYSEVESRGWMIHLGFYDELVEELRNTEPSHAAGFMPKVAKS
jgi:hypothetical protein